MQENCFEIKFAHETMRKKEPNEYLKNFQEVFDDWLLVSEKCSRNSCKKDIQLKKFSLVITAPF